jgi:hypothetical protein
MIARVATFDQLPTDLDGEAVALLRKTVRETPGYVAGFHLGAAGDKAISVLVLEDEEAGRRVAERMAARPDGDKVGIDPDRVEYFEAQPF